MQIEPQPGQSCTVLFLKSFTQYTMMSSRRIAVSFPSGIPFDDCVFQEAFRDPYTGQDKYAIQVPLNEKIWTVHVPQKDVQFLTIGDLG